MPIYEYLCVDCHEKFEALRPMSDADIPIECLHCSSSNTSRSITVFFAQSEGKVVAGGAQNCSACSSNACATCRSS